RNRAQDTGGAIYFQGTSLTIADSEFLGNRVGRGPAFGSQSVADGGAMTIQATSNGANITNTVFVGNTAQNGIGGALSVHSPPSVAFVNDTLVGNYAGAGAGGISVSDSTVGLTNMILWGNGAVAGSDLQLLDGAVANVDDDDIGLSSGTVN